MGTQQIRGNDTEETQKKKLEDPQNAKLQEMTSKKKNIIQICLNHKAPVYINFGVIQRRIDIQVCMYLCMYVGKQITAINVSARMNVIEIILCVCVGML